MIEARFSKANYLDNSTYTDREITGFIYSIVIEHPSNLFNASDSRQFETLASSVFIDSSNVIRYRPFYYGIRVTGNYTEDHITTQFDQFILLPVPFWNSGSASSPIMSFSFSPEETHHDLSNIIIGQRSIQDTNKSSQGYLSSFNISTLDGKERTIYCSIVGYNWKCTVANPDLSEISFRLIMTANDNNNDADINASDYDLTIDSMYCGMFTYMPATSADRVNYNALIRDFYNVYVMTQGTTEYNSCYVPIPQTTNILSNSDFGMYINASNYTSLFTSTVTRYSWKNYIINTLVVNGATAVCDLRTSSNSRTTEYAVYQDLSGIYIDESDLEKEHPENVSSNEVIIFSETTPAEEEASDDAENALDQLGYIGGIKTSQYIRTPLEDRKDGALTIDVRKEPPSITRTFNHVCYVYNSDQHADYNPAITWPNFDINDTELTFNWYSDENSQSSYESLHKINDVTMADFDGTYTTIDNIQVPCFYLPEIEDIKDDNEEVVTHADQQYYIFSKDKAILDRFASISFYIQYEGVYLDSYGAETTKYFLETIMPESVTLSEDRTEITIKCYPMYSWGSRFYYLDTANDVHSRHGGAYLGHYVNSNIYNTILKFKIYNLADAGIETPMITFQSNITELSWEASSILLSDENYTIRSLKILGISESGSPSTDEYSETIYSAPLYEMLSHYSDISTVTSLKTVMEKYNYTSVFDYFYKEKLSLYYAIESENCKYGTPKLQNFTEKTFILPKWDRDKIQRSEDWDYEITFCNSNHKTCGTGIYGLTFSSHTSDDTLRQPWFNYKGQEKNRELDICDWWSQSGSSYVSTGLESAEVPFTIDKIILSKLKNKITVIANFDLGGEYHYSSYLDGQLTIDITSNFDYNNQTFSITFNNLQWNFINTNDSKKYEWGPCRICLNLPKMLIKVWRKGTSTSDIIRLIGATINVSRSDGVVEVEVEK